jgi:hypothetical protein
MYKLKFDDLEEFLKHAAGPRLQNGEHKNSLRASLVRSIREGRAGLWTFPALRFALSCSAAALLIAAGVAVFVVLLNRPLAEVAVVPFGGGVFVTDGRTNARESISGRRPVEPRSVVASDAFASFKLTLPAGTTILAGGNTFVRIDSFSADGKNLTSVFSLERGKIDCSVRLPSKESLFEIRTADAVFTDRGTVFSVAVDDRGDTILSVTEGRVETVLNLARSEAEPGAPTALARLEDALRTPVAVAAGQSLTLRHDEVTAFRERVDALIRDLTSAKGDARATAGLLAAIEASKDELLAVRAADDAAPPPESPAKTWQPYAENDFSKALTPAGFNPYVLYEGGGVFDTENGRCVFTGDNAASRGVIFVKRPDRTVPGGYRIACDLIALSTVDVSLALGVWIDVDRHVFCRLDRRSLSIIDAAGRIVQTVPLQAAASGSYVFEVVAEKGLIRASVTDKSSGAVLASVAGGFPDEPPGVVYIEARGRGRAEFDNVRVAIEK